MEKEMASQRPENKFGIQQSFFVWFGVGVFLLLLYCRPVYAGPETGPDIIKLFRSPDQRLFALTVEKSGLFSSVDSGRRWKQVSLPDNLVLYDLTADRHGRLFLSSDKGIYSSEDYGETWRQVHAEPAAFTAFSRRGNDYLVKIWGKGLFLHRTALDEPGKLQPCRGLPETPVQTAIFGPDNIPYAGIFGKGVYRQPNDGEVWVPANTGLGNKNVVLLARSPAGVLFAGTYGGGLYKWIEAETAWRSVDLGFSPVVIQTLVFGSDGQMVAGTLNHGVLFSPDQGETWLQKGTGLDRENIQGLALVNNGTLFAGAYGEGMFRFIQQDDAWQKKPFAYTANVSRIDITPQGILYAGSKGLRGVFTSKDQGQTWTQVSLPFASSESVLFAVKDENLIVATRGYGPFITTEGEKDWQLIATGLPKEQDEGLKSIRALEKDRDGIVYGVQASGNGVYRLDEKLEWERVEAQGEQCRSYYSSGSMLTSGLLFFPDKNALIWDSYTTIVTRDDFSLWHCTRFGQSLNALHVDGDGTIWNSRMISTFILPKNGAAWSKVSPAQTTLYRGFHHVEGDSYLGIPQGNGLDYLSWSNQGLRVRAHYLADEKVLSAVAGSSGFFVGTEKGMWHSADNGKTWNEIVFP